MNQIPLDVLAKEIAEFLSGNRLGQSVGFREMIATARADVVNVVLDTKQAFSFRIDPAQRKCAKGAI